MDNSKVSKPAGGRGRARSRIRGQSPVGSSSPDPSILSTIGTASVYTRSESSSSSSTPSGIVSGVAAMSTSDDGSNVREPSGFPRGKARPCPSDDDSKPPGSGFLRGKASPMTDEQRAEIQDRRRDYVLTRPLDMEKEGKKGKPINLRANYFRLKTLPSWGLHQYSVEFSMVEDRTSIRKKLFRKAIGEHNTEIGYMFDGAQLFTAKRLEDSEVPMEMTTKLDQPDDPEVTMTVTYTKLVDSGAPIYVQLHNILIRKSLFALELQEMGRNFFDPEAAIKLPQQKLELWPGYVTSMRTHEKDVLLCVEVTHKVLRTDTVLQIMRAIERTGNFRDDDRARKAAVQSELKDTIVMTVYNKKTYHVDDIDFDLSPKSTFKCKGEDVSYADYYKAKYGLTINDLNQPLIISRPSKKDMHRWAKGKEEKSEPEIIMLIPELCRSTGLTDAMRADFRLMRDLSKYLHQLPNEKVKVIENFMKRLKSDKTISNDFEKWGLEFDSKPVDLTGRVLASENVIFAKGTQPVDPKGDFTMAFRSQQMLSAVQMNNWAILVPIKDAQGVDNLVRTMSKVAAPLNMRIASPKEVIHLPDIRPATYLRHLEEAVKKYPQIQMFFVILPNNKLDLYASVKKRLAVDQGIPSQCFLAKNVGSKGLMSIATKVVVQMNAKLGGEPWSVKLPLKNTMFIGFDVHRGAKGTKGGTIGAMVATFSPNFTKYFSTTSVYTDPGEELSKNIRLDVKKCIEAYQEENNGQLPEKIIMYRDGVGEGQLKLIYNVELVLIKEELHEIYSAKGLKDPGLTYIVVNKRINTRLVEMRGASHDNPPPGTVVDSIVTLPERYDFYLISCAARQGTVSPCSYNVLCDGSGLDADKIQLVTYKMCHMYFNWSGTIAVPAPCQYAHKLAFLTGMAYAGHANEKLSKLLHFL